MLQDGHDPVKHQDPTLQRVPGLILAANTAKGRGVFASTPIPSGAIIDVCPVLVFTPDEVAQHTSKTCLDHYTYNWPTTTPTTTQPSTSLPSPTTLASKHHSNPQSTSPSNPTSHTPPPTQTQALALGLGSLFNHSRQHQNVGWKRDLSHQTILYTALRDIAAGEELCISYGDKLWFEDAEEAEGEGEQGGEWWLSGMNAEEEDREENDGEGEGRLMRTGFESMNLVGNSDVYPGAKAQL